MESSLRAEITTVETSLRAEIAAVETSLRAEIAAVETSLRAEIAALGASLRAEIATVRHEMAEFKADILKSVMGMILGALAVNVVAILAGMIGLAKLLGH